MNGQRLLEQVIPVPKPPRGAAVVDLVFNVTWASLVQKDPHVQGLRLDEDLPEDFRTTVLRLRIENRGCLPLIFAWKRCPPAHFHVRVYSSGGYLDLVKILFRNKKYLPIEIRIPRPGTCTDPDPYLVPPDETPLTQVMTAEDYYDAVNTALANAPQNTNATRYRKYFADLNRETHRALLGVRQQIKNETIPPPTVDDRNTAVDWLVGSGVLANRVRNRAVGFSQTNACPPAAPIDRATPSTIATLSSVQLQVVHDHFTNNATGNLELGNFEEAYEMFANGDLRYQLPNGAWTTQPSSGYYFFFAEFALLAIQHDTAAVQWRQLAPCLVRTQRIFARVYQPADPTTADFDAYRGCNYNTTRIFTPGERNALVATYQYPDDDALCRGAAQNAVDFLPGLLPPTP